MFQCEYKLHVHAMYTMHVCAHVMDFRVVMCIHLMVEQPYTDTYTNVLMHALC